MLNFIFFFNPFLQSAELPLIGRILTIPSQLSVTCELAEITLCFATPFNNEDMKMH